MTAATSPTTAPTAIVIDPPRDIDRIESELASRSLTLELILETHVHNDYVSGGLTLSRTTSATYAHARAETLHFDHHPIDPGERLRVGDMDVEVVATPGHTEHHLAYIVRVAGQPPAAFTGGSLLYGTVGRTDLVADELTDELTRRQHRSARALADRLPDDACIYPTHGFGSFCASAGSGDDSDGTLATERRVNLALTIDDEDQFVERLVSGLTAHPAYYAHMAPINRAGGVAIDLSPPAPVDPIELARRIHRGEWVVDLRQRKLFANEHLTGTIGIELADGFATYLGWLIPWGMPLTLLADTVEQIHDAQRQLVRIGIDRPAGAASGGIDTWGGATRPQQLPRSDSSPDSPTPATTSRCSMSVAPTSTATAISRTPSTSRWTHSPGAPARSPTPTCGSIAQAGSEPASLPASSIAPAAPSPSSTTTSTTPATARSTSWRSRRTDQRTTAKRVIRDRPG